MRLAALLLASVVGLTGCDVGKLTVNTTSKVLLRAQPSMRQESDYEMARQAIPGALKTVEGFWIVAPDNARLSRILMEGYCQYGTGFVEDDWEQAKLDKNLAAAEYHNTRATNIFTRCMNYALHRLGARWQKELFGETEVVQKLVRETGKSQRDNMLFAGLALGSIINHNLTRPEMLVHIATAQLIFERVVEIDKKEGPPKDEQLAALPYVALGMLRSSRGKAMGGDPDLAKADFQMAIDLTKGKFLMPRVLMGIRIGMITNDQKYFHDQLKLVLETPPSVWPEQRLANEVAHRKARRYLSKEKELF